ncbi:MAG: ASCH domain-containing protein [Xanthomonadales bacterium]|jgi:uncharacterized protein YhfF|nr:ASCH domain-containing protein [Xanthomonadales bacterium]
MEHSLIRFLEAHGLGPEVADDLETRRLGADPAMVERILAVIERGEKSMTFSLPWLAADEGRRPPAPGRLIVLLDVQGSPRLLLRLTAVREKRFGDVDAEDLSREGKPMRDPAAWRELHEWVWNARLEPLGRQVSADMPVWAEYFERLAPA